MTPAMQLSALKIAYADHTDADAIIADLERAFSLGHAYGIHRAADAVDTGFMRDNPANTIRALRVVEVKRVKTIERDFL
jgi:hypothetical protein